MAGTDVKPIELYSWSTPNGWKIEILLDELNLPYNVCISAVFSVTWLVCTF